MEHHFTQIQLEQLRSKKISTSTVLNQMERFSNGMKYPKLEKACSQGDGVDVLTEQELEGFYKLFEKDCSSLSVSKFVPASGAATRMFQALYEALENDVDAHAAVMSMEELPFFSELKNKFESWTSEDFDTVLIERPGRILAFLLHSENGLNYGSLPKAVIPFHKYSDSIRTSIEEHLVEGALYTANNSGKVAIHFTVSPTHLKKVNALLNDKKSAYELEYSCSFDLSFSQQLEQTDTVAVDANNELLLRENGELFFRPGGHGALIYNLNELESDLVFIKNIDNVVHDDWKNTTIRYKKVLGGFLLDKQKQIFEFLHLLDQGECSETLLSKIKTFILSGLKIEIPEDVRGAELEKKLFEILNRPIRVCGMVVNEGEPGGGPYWVKAEDDSLSLQIIEKAQIDTEIQSQVDIMEKSSFFNPVDLVCGFKDYQGRKFDLIKFVDDEMAFISEKSNNGQVLKALELPGLWNGAMQGWNTWFVEVPLETFNPVKTVVDLLRPTHRLRS